jgi:hypothetical protein
MHECVHVVPSQALDCIVRLSAVPSAAHTATSLFPVNPLASGIPPPNMSPMTMLAWRALVGSPLPSMCVATERLTTVETSQVVPRLVYHIQNSVDLPVVLGATVCLHGVCLY